jgi:hypothetical protein
MSADQIDRVRFFANVDARLAPDDVVRRLLKMHGDDPWRAARSLKRLLSPAPSDTEGR